MTSIKSILLKATLKTISPFIANADFEIQRVRQDYLGSLKKKPEGVQEKYEDLGNIKAEWFFLQSTPEKPVILYFHGGAYVTGSLLSGRVLASELAFNTGYKTLAFEYRLAPENPFPAALQDALGIYGHLLSNGFSPEDIVFAGESAGGGLLLSTALSLKAQGKPLPLALICMSPWTDLTCSSPSYVFNSQKDPLLNRVYLKESAFAYAKNEKLKSPYISPLFGDFSGLPDMLLQAGADEILLDDSRVLYEKLKQADVNVTFKIWPDMWHVWQIFDIPESREALNDIRDFIRLKIKNGKV